MRPVCACLKMWLSDKMWTCLAGPTPTGPESTFNYLIDALLAVPDLRGMYLRRLRSIMDEYTNGRLAGVSLFHSFIPSFIHLFTSIYPSFRSHAHSFLASLFR